MINQKKSNLISDFMLEVTKANTFKDLEKSYKKIQKDFEKIIKSDCKGRTKTFIARYRELCDIADEILHKENNGNVPSINQVAVFGEMVALRDFCLNWISESLG